MKRFYLLLLGCLLFLMPAAAQVLPDSLKVDWSAAGYAGAIPHPALLINVKDFGAYGDSVHDDYTAIMNAINSNTGLRVIYFPAGNYLIKMPLSLPGSVVLRGEGTATNLLFSLTNGNCINVVSSQTNAFSAVDSGYTKGSSTLFVADTSGFVVNGFAEIREANGAWDTQPAAWASYNVGQVVKITSIAGNKITIEPALHINYTQSLQPQIRPVTLKGNVGIECLKISRADAAPGTYGYNINFNFAYNCWVTGIESNKSAGTHIMMSTSSHITVSGCYFHDAYTYDGTGTAGYGVTMIAHNSDSKVENCIFAHLRHSMVAKQGANGNVFAYNYSTNPYRTEIPTDAGADMLLHGHYAFANLFEGNIGQTMMTDDTWGASGPYNTFFRNRAELYGIIVVASATVSSDKQNIIGNEVTNTDYQNQKGNYIIGGSNQFAYGNNINGAIQPAGTDNLPDKSYYLTEQPYFWDIVAPWPNTGIPDMVGSGTNPARERYLNNGTLTTCLQDRDKIDQCSSLGFTLKTINASCATANDARVTVHATGGKAPYQYSMDSITYQTDSVFARLAAGAYQVWVKDASGCSATANGIFITKPAAIVVTAKTTVASSCKDDGTITIKATGGTPPYMYSLNDTAHFVTANVFTGLTSGTCIAWVKDAGGCTGVLTGITVAKKPALVLKASTTIASYCKDDGSITLIASGGTSPYKYSLNDTDHFTTTALFSNLAGGIYTGWVKDAKGCVNSLQNVTVARKAAMVLSATGTAASSCRDDGSITLKATGGTTPYTFSLNDTTQFVSGNVFAGLAAATYVGWAKDARGCAGALFNLVVSKTTFSVTVNKTNVTCKDGSDGTLTIRKTGGIAPVVYSIDGINFVTSNKFTGLTTGTYTCLTKDAKGCIASATAIIANGSKACTVGTTTNSIVAGDDKMSVNLSLNPSSSIFYLTVVSSDKIPVNIAIYDVLGKLMTEQRAEPNHMYSIGKELYPGIYFMKVVQGANVQMVKMMKVNR